ncbi:MAG: hypothetical protein JW953_13390 [Anaerolineae bacterium]|nr:hypothetical protein [Anaerolineae bacterium]
MTEEYTYFQFATGKGIEISQIESTFLHFSKAVFDEYRFFLVNDLSPYKPIPANLIDFDSIISKKLKEAVAEKDTDISFDFWLNSQITDRVSFILATSHRVALLSINRNFFVMDNTVFSFLGFCKIFYGFFCPLYGYGTTKPNDPPEFAKVDEGKIETLYTYNFLGPDMVSKYGTEKLHSIPAWQIEDLSDGGIFIAMELNPFENWEKHTPNYEKAIEILGVSRFQQGG